MEGLYIVLISVHGLLRGFDIELGRDSDTGGQIKYVVELASSLVKDERVLRVDILTRLVEDQKVDSSYSDAVEDLGMGAYIVRLPCGPRRYLRKEVLWPYLDSFTDRAIYYIKNTGMVPDIIHSHYADGGYIASRLSGLLDIPHIHTGHSLGRTKRKGLLDQGISVSQIEKQYNVSRRIEAEEITLDSASLVIASTSQEVREQYSIYDNYQVKRMVVIPPGVDLSSFVPVRGRGHISLGSSIELEIDRFFLERKKPCILALSRPDPKKNVETLLRIYGASERLRELANLVVILGNRDDIRSLDRASGEVFSNLLYLIDLYDLYGKVSYPKQHNPSDVSEIYRVVARRRGVFVNVALIEPFGLTLIESAASGLPIVATSDGGPKEIIKRCKNGSLVDPLDGGQIESAIFEILTDRGVWSRMRESGLRGVRRHFSWGAHVRSYLKAVDKLVRKKSRSSVKSLATNPIKADRVLICDIDNTLLGDEASLLDLMEKVKYHKDIFSFGVATGRSLESAVKVLREWNIPMPNIFITSVGSELNYGTRLIKDTGWERHIDYRWKPLEVRRALEGLSGLVLQKKKSEQRRHKISYFIDTKKSMSVKAISGYLRRQNIHAKVVFSHNQFLDILPIRSSKGLAVRYFAMKWNIPFENILVAGDSGNDEEMLRGNTLAVVVGNYSPELEKLRGDPYIYFASGEYSRGIIEGIDHFGFF